MNEFEWSEDQKEDEINDLIKNINCVMDEGVSNLAVDVLEEIQRHMGLVIEQGLFWLKQHNPERYVYDLRNFLIWLCDFIEEKEMDFYEGEDF